jgi:hypothetical protein
MRIYLKISISILLIFHLIFSISIQACSIEYQNKVDIYLDYRADVEISDSIDICNTNLFVECQGYTINSGEENTYILIPQQRVNYETEGTDLLLILERYFDVYKNSDKESIHECCAKYGPRYCEEMEVECPNFNADAVSIFNINPDQIKDATSVRYYSPEKLDELVAENDKKKSENECYLNEYKQYENLIFGFNIANEDCYVQQPDVSSQCPSLVYNPLFARTGLDNSVYSWAIAGFAIICSGCVFIWLRRRKTKNRKID